MRRLRLRGAWPLAAALCVACAPLDGGYDADELRRELQRATRQADQSFHAGAPVELGADGPARFLDALGRAFDRGKALRLVRTIDAGFRAPANEHYEAGLEALAAHLRAAGFGSAERLELAWLVEPETVAAWTPLSARVELVDAAGKVEQLHAFAAPADRERTLIAQGSPGCVLEGPVCLRPEDLPADGSGVLVGLEAPARLLAELGERRAAAVLGAPLAAYHQTAEAGAEAAELLAYARVPAETAIPCLCIARRSAERLRAGDGLRVRIDARVRSEPRPLRHLVATIRGAEWPDEAVVIATHLDEPGANDNASGCAAMAEGAVAVARALQQDRLSWPAAGLSFVFGAEFVQSRAWLAQSQLHARAAIAADMLGNSRARTGAIALLEREPDPALMHMLPPDEPSGWGSAQARMSETPGGLSLIARCALVDVGLRERSFESRDHPFEGGSDHQVFLERGIPAVLFWHFPDRTYHTNLDRYDRVDGRELEASALALLSTALAVADPQARDFDRYLGSHVLEEGLRIEAARAAGDPALEQSWRAWSAPRRQWLRELCLPSARVDR
jgi:aminopeptidase YwaD